MSVNSNLFPTRDSENRAVVSPHSYYMLISSLPALPPRFEVDRLPITLERLQARLRMLEPEDAQTINRMLDILDWSRQIVEASDAAVVKRYSDLMREVTNPLVREVVGVGIDVRMIVAALRRRRRGLDAPAIGFGQWFGHIRRHFNQPDFGLGYVFPWLLPFDQLLEHQDVLTLYRRMLGETWAYVRKRMQDYDSFSFEAVVLYIARWDIVRHWQQLQVERGRAVFETLVTEAMGEYAKLYS
jgi:Protein of unknown function (DUF2764)